METCFNWCEPEVCWASSDEKHWIAVIRKLAKQHPDEVTILEQPETNDGCIYAKFPQKYIHLYAPRPARQMTDEERAAHAETLRRINAAKRAGERDKNSLRHPDGAG